jgi:hypothetical protein
VVPCSIFHIVFPLTQLCFRHGEDQRNPFADSSWLRVVAQAESGRKPFIPPRAWLDAEQPKKYPGVDITSHSKKSFSRHLLVMAGSGIYTISVTCHKEASLERAKVRDFFKSFGIDE